VPDKKRNTPPGSGDGLEYGPNDAIQEALGALSSFVGTSAARRNRRRPRLRLT